MSVHPYNTMHSSMNRTAKARSPTHCIHCNANIQQNRIFISNSGIGIFWDFSSKQFIRFHVTENDVNIHTEIMATTREPQGKSVSHVTLTHDGKCIVLLQGNNYNCVSALLQRQQAAGSVQSTIPSVAWPSPPTTATFS